MTRYAQKLLRRMAPEHPLGTLRPAAPPYRVEDTPLVDPFEQMAPAQEAPSTAPPTMDSGIPPRPQTPQAPPPTRRPHSEPSAQAPHAAAPEDSQVTLSPPPPRVRMTKRSPSRSRLQTTPPPSVTGDSSPESARSVESPVPSSVSPAPEAADHAAPPVRPTSPRQPPPSSSYEEVSVTVDAPVPLEPRPHRHPDLAAPEPGIRETPFTAARAAPDTLPPSPELAHAPAVPSPVAELRPPLPNPPSTPPAPPTEPRVVIGRLTVEVTPESEPAPSRPFRPRRRAPAPAAPSESAPPPKVRFGLGQM